MIKRNFSSFILYMFGFLLLWEWLRPVEQLTDTDHIEAFIFFLLLSFFISFLNLKWIWQFLIKLFFILVCINRFHYEANLFQASWFKAFLSDLGTNVGWIIERNWNELSSVFRTLLFFVLLWLMVYLIHYWLLNRQRIFIFFFMTLVYITVLDTFTAYNAKFAIIRTVVIGFAVMGMLTFYRIIQKEHVDKEAAVISRWMTPLVIMIAFSVLVGITAPKAAPIWPDPVPYLKADPSKDAGETKSKGPRRIGYGTNDSSLGGPFVGDSNTVFHAETSGKHYYKVETKDTYTGKGWIASGSTPIPFRQEDLVPVYSIPNTIDKINQTVRITLYEGFSFNHLMYPAGVQRISKLQPSGSLLQMDTTKERILLFDGDRRPAAPKSYTMEFDIPKYKASDLTATTGWDPNVINEKFYKTYTQLPGNLPPRVTELAISITKDKTNWFDKAKAVETYFSSSDYSYDQKNVAVPGADDDYVDQFLFETKRGYCDNFSTSMATLLRTLGIPTRWVKGYTGGDFLKYSDDGTSRQIYDITNNNAHSWVEVFFPNQGWVPFEPTKGFDAGTIINYGGDSESSSNNQPITPPVKKPQQEETDFEKAMKEKGQSQDFKSFWSDIWGTVKEHWKLSTFILLLLAGLGAFIYRIRGKWLPYLILLWYRFRMSDENFGRAYLILLNQLDRYGLKRKNNQTLRNYARYIDSFFSSREMSKLTSYYEQYTYHQQLPKGAWKESRKLWEHLIKKTIA